MGSIFQIVGRHSFQYLGIGLLSLACQSSEQPRERSGAVSAQPSAINTIDSSAHLKEMVPGDAGFDAETADAETPDASAFDASVQDAAAEIPACPPEMTKLTRVCVDRWEAHLVKLSASGDEIAHSPVARPETGERYRAKSAADQFPQAYISRVEAAEACKNAGKRLCSRGEWMRACKGKRGFQYPYGPKGRKGACNTGKPHLLEMLYGRNPKKWGFEDVFNNPALNQEPGFLAKSGEHAECKSEEGAFDLVGNLHEWVRDTVGEDIEDILERDQVERKKQPWVVGNAMFMGGFFSTTSEHGPGCTYTTIAHEPTYHDYSTGFRCCKDALETPAKTKKPKG